MNEDFTRILRGWGRENRRDLPWIGCRDPYRVWISEVVLQQTRVEQGLPYYNKIITRFPDVRTLAAASEEEVLKLWEGLGYYRRARLMRRTACLVAREMDGRFPDDVDGLRALPGVGPYTAAAIASFAFGRPCAVVDGNVERLLARCFGVEEPVDTAAGRRRLAGLAEDVLDRRDPGAHNQAVMDFGSRVCRPRDPDCPACPLASRCRARASGRVADLPRKGPRARLRKRWFHWLVVERRGRLWVRKRTEGDIWPGLWEFPLVETPRPTSVERLLETPAFGAWVEGRRWRLTWRSGLHRQVLSHQDIRARFLRLTVDGGGPPEGVVEREAEVLPNLPFPRLIVRFGLEPALSSSFHRG